MQPPPQRDTDEGSRPRSSSNAGQAGGNAPLVIVSDRGRHSDESRRIVRAQAARASAAQSRVTRARNREEREGTHRDDLPSPQFADQSPIPTSPLTGQEESESNQNALTPLVRWLSATLDMSASQLAAYAQTSTPSSPVASSDAARGFATVFVSSSDPLQASSDSGRPQLPLAVPRGFSALQQRIHISDTLIRLLSRTSCFDFASPGVEERLHQLLFDLIAGYPGSSLSPTPIQGHAIQSYLRIACTCLTIFQGQRADGASFAYDSKYQRGLGAAWADALLLDQSALREHESAEASLWVVFIICVTTGSPADNFHPLLHRLFENLQLQSWRDVRNVLLEFIYPVSFLDGPTQVFYNMLSEIHGGPS